VADTVGKVEMQKPSKAIRRSLPRDSRGSEIAEFALILPLLFLALFGIFWFGQAFRIYNAITNAARDGARAAVAPDCATCGESNPTANAWKAVQNDLNSAHINPAALQQPTTLPGLCACGAGAATSCTGGAVVGCDTSQNNICVQGVNHTGRRHRTLVEDNVELASTAAGGAGECGISVSFVYPFTFTLPFTSLNNQIVNLRAQAQMRVETQ
jgi:Flp pilus assembly protein TadG